MVSSSTGQVISATNFGGLLRVALEEILLRSIRWELLVNGLASYVQSAGYAKFVVTPIASTSDRCLRPSIERLLGANAYTALVTATMADSQLARSDEQTRSASKSKIAIVGISGRFPHAADMNGFWDVLREGRDVHEVVPPSRWNAHTHVDPTLSRKNVSGTGFGCWLHDAAKFDARYFNMSPREAPQVDPAQRLALLTATEALEQAGIVGDRTPSTQKDRIGVYFGATSNDWMETNSAQDIDTYFIPGGNRAFIPGRINYHFKFSGPSYTVDTACSSSLAAIHMACNALWRNEVDVAIVGGTNVLTNPDMTAGLDRGHFLSRTGNCKTFDESADGYCRGEAVATAILRRLDDAVADKDPIEGCILGIATNHSAEADSITRPHVGAQRALFEALLHDTGVDARSISYVEMHGTGTQAGDAGETASVLDTFASHLSSEKRNTDQPLYIGAAKANIGHGESAAGITSLAKVLLMLKNSTIPPHCGIKTRINTKIPDLAIRNTFIAGHPVPWPRPPGGFRQVFLNNFSAAGGNTALILEDAPEKKVSNELDPRKHHLVAVSGKTPTSLENNMKNMISWIENTETNGLTLSRLSYTTTARRIHHPYRVMATGPTLEQVKIELQESIRRKDGSNRAKGTPGFVFAFTGQGAQFAGMGNILYTNFSSFRADIRRYDQISQKLGFSSIRACFEDLEPQETSTPAIGQLVSICLQMALVRLWASFGVTPKAVVGHSLGEYAALNAAGVLSESDTIYLVGLRAQLLDARCTPGSHAMLAVRSAVLDVERVLTQADQSYEVSCVNGCENLVLGGTKEGMEKAKAILSKEGIKATFLEVPYAFHTSQVDAILAKLSYLSHGVKLANPSIPVISTVYGSVIRDSSSFGPEYIRNHCRECVNLLGAVNAAQSEGVINEKIICIEIGPSPVVVRMLKEIVGANLKTFASVQRGQDTWKLLTQALAQFYINGADIRWTGYHHDFESSQVCLEIPAYSWDLKEYWMQYVHDWSLRKGDPIPRANLQRLESSSVHKVVQDTLESNGGELTVECDLCRPDLYPMVQGHKVYGVPLCTPVCAYQ